MLGAFGSGTVYGGLGRAKLPEGSRCGSKPFEGGGGGSTAVPEFAGRPLGPMYAPGGGMFVPLFIPPDGPM